jgi:hypothetical protein
MSHRRVGPTCQRKSRGFEVRAIGLLFELDTKLGPKKVEATPTHQSRGFK